MSSTDNVQHASAISDFFKFLGTISVAGALYSYISDMLVNPIVTTYTNRGSVKFENTKYTGSLPNNPQIPNEYVMQQLTWEQKTNKGLQNTMNNLLGHYAQPIGDYQQVANQKFNQDFWKDLNNIQQRSIIMELAIKKMEFLPKDMVFLTFDLTSPESFANPAWGTWTGHSFLIPNYIGPLHILLKIMKSFNIQLKDESTKELYNLLKQLQRISFYNHPAYDRWQNGEITLGDAIREINVLIDYDKKQNPDFMGLADASINVVSTKNTLPYPSWGIKHRHGKDRSYTSVIFIGKYNNSAFNLPQHKKWCWLKNSDGFIYNGEYFPADMEIMLNNGNPLLSTESMIVGPNKLSISLMYYECTWSGFLVNIFDKNNAEGSKNKTVMKRAQYGYDHLGKDKNLYRYTYGGKNKLKKKTKLKRKTKFKRKTNKRTKRNTR